MRTRSWSWLVLGVCVLAIAHPAGATVHNLTASLDGLQEDPDVPTPATGSATMTLDDVTNMFTLSGSFQNLIGTSSNGHVHGPSPLGGPSAGVMFAITFDFGVNSGNFSFNGAISQLNEDRILAGDAYINIHSTFRTGGEIRGQILPEPTSLAILSLGMLGLVRRRR